MNPPTLGHAMLIAGWALLLVYVGLILLYRFWWFKTDSPLLRIFPAFTVGPEVNLFGLAAMTLIFDRGLEILAVISVYFLLAFSAKIAWAGVGWRVTDSAYGSNSSMGGSGIVANSNMFFSQLYQWSYCGADAFAEVPGSISQWWFDG